MLGSELVRGADEEALSREQRALVRFLPWCRAGSVAMRHCACDSCPLDGSALQQLKNLPCRACCSRGALAWGPA